MPRKKKPPISIIEQIKKLQNAKIADNKKICTASNNHEYNDIEDIELRIKHILGLTERIKKTPNKMLFFVMYDIEDNKVRRLVSKYLLRKGCTRIQKSVFLAETPVEIFSDIKNDLSEVQAAYDNNDSIIILPITTDYLRMMKIIGQNINIDIITHSKNTLFF